MRMQDEFQYPGSSLLLAAERMSEAPYGLKPWGVCRSHQLFAGAALLLRYMLESSSL